MTMKTGAAAYQKTGNQSGVLDADPHRLIQLLYQAALDNLAKAKGFMQRKDYEAKGQAISKTLEIVGSLQGVLDHEKGGEIAANLDRLYTYVLEQTFEASRLNDAAMIDEVSGIIREIKSGWDDIRDQYVKMGQQEAHQAETDSSVISG